MNEKHEAIWAVLVSIPAIWLTLSPTSAGDRHICPPAQTALRGGYSLQGQGHGQGRGHQKIKSEKRNDTGEERGNRRAADPLFGPRERDIITGYFGGPSSNLPPGLAKRDGRLPPGLEKHLEREGTLPPGLQKRLTPFPQDLGRRLPPLPPNYRRGIIGSDVLLVDIRNWRVVDIMYHVMVR